ncbi:GNAT family N-acetyltransferase, partial [Bacillus vallismortis]|nr:GNAT family N-acetyltransferase [Bacillus vallismortis]
MTLTLEDMTVEEFEAFRGVSVQNYAKQNIKSGTWTEKEAFEKSEQAYENMIPEGRNSSNHYFWN